MSYRPNEHKMLSTVPLIPEIARIRVQGQEDEIITQGGQIQVQDLWTTEALIDRLRIYIIQVKEEKKQPDSPRSSSFRYDRKYLNCAVAVIEDWSKVERTNRPPEFTFYLSDILASDKRLVAELIDLGNTSPTTISYVLHKVVEWLFEMVGVGWFYQSAAEDIKVRIEP